uniref:SOSS complex subunit A homolog n=1 Tax=Angiostrongylus cantonensis TaxID=6313 RepID=A0A0K0DGS2_ANGCA
MDVGFARRLSRLVVYRERYDQPPESACTFVTNSLILEGKVNVLSEKVYGVHDFKFLERKSGKLYFRCLSIIANDQWYAALCNVNMVLIELWPKLHESCRELMLQFFREAVKLNVPKVCFIRVRAYAFVYIHIIFKAFLCVMTIKILCLFFSNRFTDALMLGRELLLILMRLAKIPQINLIWVDLITNPTKFGLNDGEELKENKEIGIQLFSIKIFFFRVFLQLSTDRYFVKVVQFFRGPDGPSLRAEAIRYVLYFFKPDMPTHVLEARGHFLYYLLTTIPPNVSSF